MRPLKWLLALVIVLAIGLFALPILRSAERESLTPEARARLGGDYVTLSDGVTHYQQAGPEGSPVVVLVHGFSVPLYIWDPTFDALAQAGYRVIRYDQYGRGYSDRPRVRYDRALFVRQLGELLDSLRVTEPVALVGLSMGGKIVPAFAAERPERVTGVVLVDPASAPTDIGPARLPIVGPWLIRTFAVPDMAAGQVTDFLHPERFPDWVDRYRVQMLYRGFGRSIASSIRHFGVHDPTADFAALKSNGIPVLVIWGAEDTTTPIDAAPRVVELTGAELLRVEDAGHLPHLERPDLVHAALLRFLATAPVFSHDDATADTAVSAR